MPLVCGLLSLLLGWSLYHWASQINISGDNYPGEVRNGQQAWPDRRQGGHGISIPYPLLHDSSTAKQAHDSHSFVNRLNSVSYWQNSLLGQDSFAARTAYKRQLSIAESRTNFLACISEKRVTETNRKFGTEFKEQLFACMKLHIPIEKYEMDAFKAINVEHKYFLPLDSKYYADPKNKCIYLTVGIGNHTQAEREFHKVYPRCELFGVEMVPVNEADYATFGTVIHAGIGFNLTEDQVIMANYTDYAGHTNYNLTLRPFESILDIDVRSRLIHYASIDIDGYEFRMLREFEDFGWYHANGIALCQIDVELHSEISFMPGVVNDDHEFGTFMRRFLHNATTYLPIYASPYDFDRQGRPHPWNVKMTLINVKNVDCEEAFRFSKYFQR